MAPAASLARLRKRILDRVARKEVSAVQVCREVGMSTSRFYELRARYLAYGETGLLPKPRPLDPAGGCPHRSPIRSSPTRSSTLPWPTSRFG